MKCKDCKYWKRLQESRYSVNMGDCSKLSAIDGEEYPDSNVTGIEGSPLCVHDGMITTIETKEWFGCIHFNTLNK